MREILTLKGKTLKGKNRIRELGDQWIVCLYRDAVSFSPIRRPGGGWLLIAPLANSEMVRWILLNDDPDFKVLLVKQIDE